MRNSFSTGVSALQTAAARPLVRHSHPFLASRSFITPSCRHNASTSGTVNASDTSSLPNPRWLSDVRSRLGACIKFGCQGEEIELAGKIAATLAREWKGLIAGTEGFYIDDAPEETNWREATLEVAEPSEGKVGNSWIEGARWGDMDSMGHVNNASYLRYAEISRIYYFRRLARYVSKSSSSLPGTPDDKLASPTTYLRSWLQLWTPHSIGLIYKRAEVDFLLPVTYPDRLTLCHRISDDLPEPGQPINLIPLHVVALSHAKQRNSVRVYEENVVYDYRKQARITMPEWMIDVLRSAKADEDRNKVMWRKRRAVVEGWVEELEAMTVKSGKAEDMGT